MEERIERGEVRSGLTIAGAYADKLRKALFAQFASKVKTGELSKEDVARASRELNTFLYHILVEKLKLDKLDVVRINIKYEVHGRELRWDYDHLRIEAYKRIPQEKVDETIMEAVRHVKEIIEGKYIVEEIGKTLTGDTLYKIRLGDLNVGVLEAIRLNDELLIKGALISPEPVMVEKIRIELYGRNPLEVLTEKLNEIISKSRKISRTEAEEAIKTLISMLKIPTA